MSTKNSMDAILTKEQFNELDVETQAKYMEHWRSIHTTADIRRGLGISSSGLYKALERLGLPTTLNKPGEESKATNKPKKPQKNTPTPSTVANKIQGGVEKIEVSTPVGESHAMAIKLSETMTCDKFKEKMDALMQFLNSDEPYTFTIEVAKQ